METLEKHVTPTPPVGVIESLTSGFETVAGRLVLLLLPLLLDLFLWFGPRMTFKPALEYYYHDMWEPLVTTLDQDMQATLADFSQMLLNLADQTPVIYLPVVGLPSLMAGREAEALPLPYSPPIWQVQKPWGAVGVNLLSLLVSLLLGSVYVALIASQVESQKIRLKHILARYPVTTLWLAAFVIILPILMLIVYMPFVLLAVGISLVSQFLGFVVDWVGRLLFLWVALFLIFAVHGLYMNERALPGAIWDSVRVVQWNMSATLFLALLVVVLNLAMSYIWSLAPAGSWLAPVAIAGNAFINTGLIAATFVFFKDRYRYWREMRAELIAELERRRAQQGREA